MPPIYGKRPKPLEPLELDRRTVAELARVLTDRLAQLDAFSGRCPTCHDAEASALLARLRRLLDAIDRGMWCPTNDSRDARHLFSTAPGVTSRP